MWTELQFAKFQNIMTSASWFHAWTPTLELQTKNAIEITCWFQKSNIGDLQLRSWNRSRATRLQGWQEKAQGKEKLKLIWTNQLYGWKEWYSGSKKIFSFWIWTYRTGGTKMFILINLWRHSLPTWRKVKPIYSFLLQSKIFLTYIM